MINSQDSSATCSRLIDASSIKKEPEDYNEDVNIPSVDSAQENFVKEEPVTDSEDFIKEEAIEYESEDENYVSSSTDFPDLNLWIPVITPGCEAEEPRKRFTAGQLARRKRRKLRQKLQRKKFRAQLKALSDQINEQQKENISPGLLSCLVNIGQVEEPVQKSMFNKNDCIGTLEAARQQQKSVFKQEDCIGISEATRLQQKSTFNKEDCIGTSDSTRQKSLEIISNSMSIQNSKKTSDLSKLPIGIRAIPDSLQKTDFSSQIEFDLQCCEETTEKVAVAKFHFPDSYKIKYSHDTMSGYRVPKSVKALQSLCLENKLRHFFKCCHFTCSYSSDNADDISVHLLCHTQDVELFCIYCGLLFDTPSPLIEHMGEVHAKRVYQCRKCLYRAVSRKHVVFHCKVVHRGATGVFACREIKHFSIRAADRIVNIFKVLPYKCSSSFCSFEAIDSQKLIAHILSEHSSDQKFPCSICNDCFSSPYEIVSHFVTHNYDVFQCAYCPYCCEHMNDMENHVCHYHADYALKYFIRDEKLFKLYHELDFNISYLKYQGVFRKNRFKEIKQASTEASVNTDIGELDQIPAIISFCCPECQETFNKVGLFRSHLYKHKRYLPFCCTVCNKKFYSKQSFDNHKEKHSGSPKLKTSFTVSTEQWVDDVICEEQNRLKHLILHKFLLKECEFLGCSKVCVEDIHVHFQECHFAKKTVCLDCGYISFCSEAVNRHKSSVHSANKTKPKVSSKSTNTSIAINASSVLNDVDQSSTVELCSNLDESSTVKTHNDVSESYTTQLQRDTIKTSTPQLPRDTIKTSARVPKDTIKTSTQFLFPRDTIETSTTQFPRDIIKTPTLQFPRDTIETSTPQFSRDTIETSTPQFPRNTTEISTQFSRDVKIFTPQFPRDTTETSTPQFSRNTIKTSTSQFLKDTTETSTQFPNDIKIPTPQFPRDTIETFPSQFSVDTIKTFTPQFSRNTTEASTQFSRDTKIPTLQFPRDTIETSTPQFSRDTIETSILQLSRDTIERSTQYRKETNNRSVAQFHVDDSAAEEKNLSQIVKQSDSTAQNILANNVNDVPIKQEPSEEEDDDIEFIGEFQSPFVKNPQTFEPQKMSDCSKKCGYCNFKESTLSKLREHCKQAHEGLPMKFVNLQKKECPSPPVPSKRKSNLEEGTTFDLHLVKKEPRLDETMNLNKFEVPSSSKDIKNSESVDNSVPIVDNIFSSAMEILIYCCYCKAKPLPKAKLLDHLKKRHKDLPFEYYDSRADCYYTLNPDENLDLKCFDCELKFDARLNLVKHLLEEHQSYMCLLCSKYFRKKNLLALHSFKQHYQTPAQLFNFIDGRVIVGDLEPEDE